MEAVENTATGAVSFKLKPEFGLDGTHLNPSYLRLMEQAFSKFSFPKGMK